MEKTWNDFWVTGKVEDYLSYKSSTKDEWENQTEKDQDIHGTVSSVDRNGAR